MRTERRKLICALREAADRIEGGSDESAFLVWVGNESVGGNFDADRDALIALLGAVEFYKFTIVGGLARESNLTMTESVE